MTKKINVAIVGVGNCASSLVQGVQYYSNGSKCEGLLHKNIGEYKVSDITFVLAFDVDERKIGKDLSKAIFSKPNVTTKFCNVSNLNAPVLMGNVLDGVSKHMSKIDESMSFKVAKESSVDIVRELKGGKVHILINYLPVGSKKATEFYAEAAIKAGCAFINCIPTFIASNEEWSNKFAEAKLPVLGDDIKSQLGATWTHRVLTQAFLDKGIRITKTSQENFGGNTDFLNMMDNKRILSKLKSKKSSIEHLIKDHKYGGYSIPPIYAGPGKSTRKHGYIKGKKDFKTAIILIEGVGFGGGKISLKATINVEDSPNSAGVVIDAIRCAKLSIDRKIYGNINDASPFFFKHPLNKVEDPIAITRIENFIKKKIK